MKKSVKFPKSKNMLKDRIFILVCTLILFLVTRQDVIKIPIIKKTEIWKPPHIVHFLRDDEEGIFIYENA